MNEIASSVRAVNLIHRNRAIIFSLFALVLVVLSFHGVLDNLAFSKIGELIKSSLELLLVSMGINATISILQTIEIPFVSIQVGQSLDPVNDAAERLSLVLVWATGSLLLQDILLKIASGSIFKWGFLAIAAVTVTSLLLAQSNRVRIAFATGLGVSHVAFAQLQGFFIKIFIVATVVRFIVPTFAVASLLVSQALVAPEIEQHSRELARQEKSLSEMGTQISEAREEMVKEQTNQDEISTQDETEDSVSDEEVEQTSSPTAQAAFLRAEGLQVLGEQKVQLEKTLALLESERERLSTRIDKMENSGWKDWIRKFAGNPEEALAEASARVAQIESEIARKESEVACIDRSTTGKNCESYLAEHGKQALSEFKIQLESEQKDLRERLQSLQEVREKYKAETSGEGEAGWRDKIAGALPRLLGDDSVEEVDAVQPTVKDIDREVAEASTLEKQNASDLICVDRRMTGEHCDSSAVDDHVQNALDGLKERLESDLQRLRTELTSRQGEQERLAELETFKTEHRQNESEIEKTKKLIDGNESELECAERRVAGEDCDTIADDVRQLMAETGTAASDIVSSATEAAGKGLSSAGQAAGRVVSSVTEATNRAFSKMSRGVLDGFKTIVDDSKDMVTRMAQILVLVVIENIVLPIIFLAIALKASVPIASGLMRICTTINEDTREALSAMDRALPSRKG